MAYQNGMERPPESALYSLETPGSASILFRKRSSILPVDVALNVTYSSYQPDKYMLLKSNDVSRVLIKFPFRFVSFQQ